MSMCAKTRKEQFGIMNRQSSRSICSGVRAGRVCQCCRWKVGIWQECIIIMLLTGYGITSVRNKPLRLIGWESRGI